MQQSRQKLPASALLRLELFARSLDAHFGLTI
jgi:hypothetical protein